MLPKASSAVTVTESALPAVTEAGVPERTSVAAAAGLTDTVGEVPIATSGLGAVEFWLVVNVLVPTSVGAVTAPPPPLPYVMVMVPPPASETPVTVMFDPTVATVPVLATV